MKENNCTTRVIHKMNNKVINIQSTTSPTDYYKNIQYLKKVMSLSVKKLYNIDKNNLKSKYHYKILFKDKNE